MAVITGNNRRLLTGYLKSLQNLAVIELKPVFVECLVVLMVFAEVLTRETSEFLADICFYGCIEGWAKPKVLQQQKRHLFLNVQYNHDTSNILESMLDMK